MPVELHFIPVELHLEIPRLIKNNHTTGTCYQEVTIFVCLLTTEYLFYRFVFQGVGGFFPSDLIQPETESTCSH